MFKKIVATAWKVVEDTGFLREKNSKSSLLATNESVFEETGSLSFTVVASDGVNDDVSKTVTLNINNLDEVPPAITSASAIAVQETYVDQDPDSQSQDLTIFVNEAVYQTTVDDSSDIPTSGATDVTYALTDGSDPAINIDENTGEVTLDTSGLEFSYINQQAYTFGIVATDAANNVSDAHTVILSVEEAIPREASVEVTYSGVDGQPTSNGEIQVSNIKPGSTWEYSTDGGANWESGTYDSDIDASAIGEGSFTIVGDGEQRRDFTHVEDIVDGLYKVGFRTLSHDDAWELGTGVNYSINQVYEFFKDRFGVDKVNLPDQFGNYRKTLRENDDAIKRLNWWPKDRLRTYIESL